MIELLGKLFIKNRTDVQNPAVRDAYAVLCCIVGIVLNVLLFSGKLAAGLVSGALSVTADAFNNLSDAGSSVITLLGFKMAEKAKDKDHPFGHGRMEYISGLLVSIVIVITGFELAQSSVKKILNPEPVVFSWLSVGILGVSILVKLYMSLYNRKIGRKIGSVSMEAASLDSLTDCISTAAVLLCMLIVKFAALDLDAYFGLAVSIIILIAGIRSAIETINPLLGEAPSKEFVSNVEKIAKSDELVCGIHDLAVHDYGPGRRMISLHAEVPCTYSVNVIHEHIDRLERTMKEQLGCETVIHMDPVDIGNEEVEELRREMKDLLKTVDPAITIHDLRIVSGETQTKVIFDVVLPVEKESIDREITEKVKEKLKEHGNYVPVINFDIAYEGG